MSDTVEAQVLEAEERLRLAMLHGDTEALGELLAPNLLFTNHLGQRVTQQQDIDAHASGLLKIDEIFLSERDFRQVAGAAIVSARASIRGRYDGAPANGDFRFTRVWARPSEGAWQVVVAHACGIV